MGRGTVAGTASARIAVRLKDAFERSEHTYRSLAMSSGLTKGAVENALGGQTAIAVDVVIALALELGESPGDLVREAAEMVAASAGMTLHVASEPIAVTSEPVPPVGQEPTR